MPGLQSQFISPGSPALGENTQANQYQNGFQILNEYEFDPGVCILPLAEDPPTDPNELATWSPVVRLQLHAPYRIRKTRTDTYKQNNPPVLPNPGDTGSFIFVGGNIAIGTALNSSLFNFDWKVITEYIFVENCVSRPQDGLVLGIPPWTWQTSSSVYATTPPATPSIGAVANAGFDVLVADTLGTQTNLSNPNGYLYPMPSYLSGVFFDTTDMLNGGTPVSPNTLSGG